MTACSFTFTFELDSEDAIRTFFSKIGDALLTARNIALAPPTAAPAKAIEKPAPAPQPAPAAPPVAPAPELPAARGSNAGVTSTAVAPPATPEPVVAKAPVTEKADEVDAILDDVFGPLPGAAPVGDALDEALDNVAKNRAAEAAATETAPRKVGRPPKAATKPAPEAPKAEVIRDPVVEAPAGAPEGITVSEIRKLGTEYIRKFSPTGAKDVLDDIKGFGVETFPALTENARNVLWARWSAKLPEYATSLLAARLG